MTTLHERLTPEVLFEIIDALDEEQREICLSLLNERQDLNLQTDTVEFTQ